MPLRTIVMLGAMVWTFAAQAVVPAFIAYSGRLSDGTAWGQSTTLDLVLTLYDAEVDGAVVFQGKHQGAQVVDGYFTVNLGMCDDLGACDPNPANATFPATLPDALWLGVAVDDRPELPRVPVGATPYSVRAGEADHVAGLDLAGLDGRFVQEGQSGSVTSGMLKDGAVATADLADASVTDTKLAEGAVTLDAIAPNGCQPGQTLRWTGLAWVCEDMLSKVEAETQFAFVTDPCPSDMVLVGDFCVDRYEASVWERKDGGPVDCQALQAAVDEALAAGWTESEVYYGNRATCGNAPVAMCGYRQYGSRESDNGCDDYPATWPDSGNWTKKLAACAVLGVKPSRALTWFQAQQACGASGRHLITNGEWQAAVAGSPDPGPSSGADGSCNTNGNSVRRTGEAGGKCVSRWGVEDMIGNLWEWVDLWGQSGQSSSNYVNGTYVAPWPAGYSATDEDGVTTGSQTRDGTWNINGISYSSGTAGYTAGRPFAAHRGGASGTGAEAGAFAFSAFYGPSHWNWDVGFRCSRSGAGMTAPSLVADNAVTSAKVVDGSLALSDLGASGCADGQLPKWDEGGSKWVCSNDLGGEGAQYDAGAGLDLAGTTFQVDPIGIASVLAPWDQDVSDDVTKTTTFNGDVGGTFDALELAPAFSDGSAYDARFVNAGSDSMSGTLTVGGNIEVVSTSTATAIAISSTQGVLAGGGLAYIYQAAATNTPTLYVRQTGSGGNPYDTQGLLLEVEGTGNGTGYALRVRGKGVDRFVVMNGGNVGIGTSSPTERLEVSGTVKATSFNPPSSRALKKSIAPLPVADQDALLAALESTDVVRYRYKTEPDSRRLHVGVIAEEAPEEILSEDGKSVSLGDWSGVLTASVKALARWVHGLEGDRDDLWAENERLRARMERIEAENAALVAGLEALRRRVDSISVLKASRP